MKYAFVLMAALASCAAPPPPWELPEETWHTTSNVLKDPVRVREVVGQRELVLEDGRRIRLTKDVAHLKSQISDADRLVEVVPLDTDSDETLIADVIVRMHLFACGDVCTEYWIRSRLSSR